MKSQLALIVPIGGSGGRPDNTLPGPGSGGSGGRPDNTLPGEQPGIDNSLPIGGGEGGRPDNTLPLPPVRPDNTLPETTPPPQVALPIVLPPGTTPPEEARFFELKYTARYGWVLVPVSDPVAAPKH